MQTSRLFAVVERNEWRHALWIALTGQNILVKEQNKASGSHPYLTLQSFRDITWLTLPVWPDWALFRTLGNFSIPLTTISLPKRTQQHFLSFCLFGCALQNWKRLDALFIISHRRRRCCCCCCCRCCCCCFCWGFILLFLPSKTFLVCLSFLSLLLLL